MQSKTIETKFDSKALPRWAQNDAKVVELCKIDLAFRVNVYDADTKQAREMCKREADNRPRMGAPIKYTGGTKLRAVKVPLTDEEFARVKLIPMQERAERLLKTDAARAG